MKRRSKSIPRAATRSGKLCGFLYKHSISKWKKAGWHLRYFTLDKKLGRLSYWKTENAYIKDKKSNLANPRGSVTLFQDGVELWTDARRETGKYTSFPEKTNNCWFQIKSPEGIICLCTTNVDDFTLWTDTIKECIARKSSGLTPVPTNDPYISDDKEEDGEEDKIPEDDDDDDSSDDDAKSRPSSPRGSTIDTVRPVVGENDSLAVPGLPTTNIIPSPSSATPRTAEEKIADGTLFEVEREAEWMLRLRWSGDYGLLSCTFFLGILQIFFVSIRSCSPISFILLGVFLSLVVLMSIKKAVTDVTRTQIPTTAPVSTLAAMPTALASPQPSRSSPAPEITDVPLKRTKALESIDFNVRARSPTPADRDAEKRDSVPQPTAAVRDRDAGKLPSCVLAKQTEPTQIQCWSPLDGTTFRVRMGPNYSKNKVKGCSAKSLSTLVQMDMYQSDRKITNVATKFVWPAECRQTGDFVIIVNVMLPLYGDNYSCPGIMERAPYDGPSYNLIMWCVVSAELYNESKSSTQGATLLLRRFLNAHNTFNGEDIYNRFKMIGRLENMEEISFLGNTEKSLINKYNATPILTRPQHTVIHGDNYCEIDVDVHSFGLIARKGLSLLGGKIKHFVLDWSFVIEGQTDDELPETILCCARLHKVDRSLAPKLSF